MTRWARSGNTQKHTKMPGDATPWEEFAQKLKDKTHEEQNSKVEKRHKLNNKDVFKNKNLSNHYNRDKSLKVHKFSSNLNTETQGAKKRGIYRDNPRAYVYGSSNSESLKNVGEQSNEKGSNLKNNKKSLEKQNNLSNSITKQDNFVSETSVKYQNKESNSKRKFQEFQTSVSDTSDCAGESNNEVESNSRKLKKSIKEEDNSSDLLPDRRNHTSETRVLSKNQMRKARIRKFQELYASQSIAKKVQTKEEYIESAENRDNLEGKIEKRIKKADNSSDLIPGEHNNTSETRVLSKNQIRKAKKRKFQELHASQSIANGIQSNVQYSETAENRDKLEDKMDSNTMKLEKKIKNEDNSSDLIPGEHNNTSDMRVLSKNQIRKAKRRKFLELHASQSIANEVQNNTEYSETAENKDKLEDKLESTIMKLEKNINNEDNSSDSIPGEHNNTSGKKLLSKNQIRKAKKRKFLELRASQSISNEMQNNVQCSETSENRDKIEVQMESNTMKLEKNIKDEDNSSVLIPGEHNNASEKQVLSKKQKKKAKRKMFQELHASQSIANEIQNNVEYSEIAENCDKLEGKMETNTMKLEKNIKDEDNSSDLIPCEHNTSDTQVLSKDQVRKTKRRKFQELHSSQSGVNKMETDEITNNSSLSIDGSSVGQNSQQKKNKFLEKVRSERKKNGIMLLSPKVEKKIYRIKKSLREKGFPPEMIKDIIRKERRTQELNIRRVYGNKSCLNCRQKGHLLAECPQPLGKSNQETGICFKCGSTEHSSYKCRKKVEGYPFAKCFICKEQGHISKDCPKNEHGVYPKGGQCNLCGNINHLKKDCPTLNKKKSKEKILTLSTINEGGSIDAELIENSETTERKHFKKPKVVKF